MAVWLVRAGKHGEQQNFALENNVAVYGWREPVDLSTYKTKAQLKEHLENAYPDWSPNKIGNVSGQLWAFVERIENDDIIALPLKDQDAIAFGRVTGEYRFEPQNTPGAQHTRPVEWFTQEFPRDRLDQDLLYSLGAFMTVCQIKRNNVEPRIRALLEGRKPTETVEPAGGAPEEDEASDATAAPNLDDYALTQIRTFIGRKYAGHGLAEIVEAILRAQGYQTELSSPGADGGVDIIAGKGALGFDPPRLCVQVKATGAPQDVKVLRELKGAMGDFNAEQGLFVSWSGFKRSVLAEARRKFFEIRLWDASDVVTNVQRYYDQFPDDLKAGLPLKRIWVLAQEEDSE